MIRAGTASSTDTAAESVVGRETSRHVARVGGV